jgi:hypothetical protein
MPNKKAHQKNPTSNQNSGYTNSQDNFVEIPLKTINSNIGDDITNAQNLKFELSCFEKFTIQIVEFTLILLHLREKQNQKEYNALQDLKLAKTNCQTTKSKIQFNEDVGHFVSERILNPVQYIV